MRKFPMSATVFLTEDCEISNLFTIWSPRTTGFIVAVSDLFLIIVFANFKAAGPISRASSRSISLPPNLNASERRCGWGRTQFSIMFNRLYLELSHARLRDGDLCNFIHYRCNRQACNGRKLHPLMYRCKCLYVLSSARASAFLPLKTIRSPVSDCPTKTRLIINGQQTRKMNNSPNRYHLDQRHLDKVVAVAIDPACLGFSMHMMEAWPLDTSTLAHVKFVV